MIPPYVSYGWYLFILALYVATYLGMSYDNDVIIGELVYRMKNLMALDAGVQSLIPVSLDKCSLILTVQYRQGLKLTLLATSHCDFSIHLPMRYFTGLV